MKISRTSSNNTQLFLLIQANIISRQRLTYEEKPDLFMHYTEQNSLCFVCSLFMCVLWVACEKFRPKQMINLPISQNFNPSEGLI